MGQNIDALIWRANKVDANGHMVTTDALAEMATALRPGCCITRDFDFRQVVGWIVQAWTIHDDLYLTATFDDPGIVEALREGKLAVRPGFSIEEQHEDANGHRVIDRVAMAYVAISPNPLPLPGEQDCCCPDRSCDACETDGCGCCRL